MKYFIIGLIFMISPFLSFGHNPLSARYHLEVGDQATLLTIHLSQDGVNNLLYKKIGKEKYESISSVELEEWIVNHIKSNFNLSIDNNEIELQKGGIKLGSHQTDLKFVLPPFSKGIEKIDFHIPAFAENENHQTIFTYNIEGISDRVILSEKNDFQSTIVLHQVVAQSNQWMWFVLIGLISLVSIFLLKGIF